MKIYVRAKPGAKKPRIEETSGLFGADAMPRYVVAVNEPAKEGKANRAIEEALAEYFNMPVSRVHIVSGHMSRDKVVEIG